MSYWAQALAARDEDLTARMVACAASEKVSEPFRWIDMNKHELTAAPGWAAAYESAMLNEREHPGRDSDVITDGMILAAVQALITSRKEEEDDRQRSYPRVARESDYRRGKRGRPVENEGVPSGSETGDD